MFWEYQHIYWITFFEIIFHFLPSLLYYDELFSSFKNSTNLLINNTVAMNNENDFTTDRTPNLEFILLYFTVKIICCFHTIFSSYKFRKSQLLGNLLFSKVFENFGIYFHITNIIHIKSKPESFLLTNEFMISNYTMSLFYSFVSVWKFHWLLEYFKKETIFGYATKKSFGFLKVEYFIGVGLFSGIMRIMVEIYGFTNGVSKVSSKISSVVMIKILIWLASLVSYVFDVILGYQNANKSSMWRGYTVFNISYCLSAGFSGAVSHLKNAVVTKHGTQNVFSLITISSLIGSSVVIGIHWAISLKLEKYKTNIFGLGKVRIFTPKEFQINPYGKLGSGFFGAVYEGFIIEQGFLNRTQNRKPAAVKLFPSGMSGSSGVVTSVKKELKVMMRLLQRKKGHENVINLHGLFWDKDSRRMGITMDLCRNGSLLEYLNNIGTCGNKHGVSLQPYLISWAKQALEGLKYLSSMKIMHGDLAARNVLLDEKLNCKISDFGMSQNLYEYQGYTKRGDEGQVFPWRWMAPECLDMLQFSLKSDVWSYGVLLWEIFSAGKLPYGDMEWSSKFCNWIKQNNRLSKPLYASQNIYDSVMLKCWEVDAESRPKITDLVIVD